MIADADSEGMIVSWSNVIQDEPENAEAYSNRGEAFWLQGDYEKAIADYDRAIALDPNKVDYFQTRGGAYLDQAVRLVPEYPDSYAMRGMIRSVVDAENVEAIRADLCEYQRLAGDAAEAGVLEILDENGLTCE